MLVRDPENHVLDLVRDGDRFSVKITQREISRMTNPDDLQQLAPTGKLRGGIVVSPAASAFFAIKDGKGCLLYTSDAADE